MKILWIEDKGDVVKSSVFEKQIFKQFWTNSEIEKLKELRIKHEERYMNELKKYSVPLYLAANLSEAWEIIKESKETFDKIIIDIEFSDGDFDFELSSIYELFSEYNGNIDDILSFIKKDEYMGFNLAHLILNHYKKSYDWNNKQIENSICFFSANAITEKEFLTKMKDTFKFGFSYDTNIKEIKQFSKNKDENFLSWLTENEYTLIFKKYLSDSSDAVETFLEVTRKKDSFDKTNISGNLLHLRQLIENHIAKTIISKISGNFDIIPKWKPQIEKNDNKVNMGGFLSILNSIIPVLDKKDKGFLILTDEEIKKLLSHLKIQMEFSKVGILKLNFGVLDSAIQQKNNELLNNNIKNIDELTFKFENRLNTKLKATEIIYFYLQNSWSTLSELIHDDKTLTEMGEQFIKKEERAVNTINIIYYQLKEIIIWFGEVMEHLQNQK